MTHPTGATERHGVAVPLGLRSGMVLGLASLIGALMLAWPLLIDVEPGAERVDPPFLFLVLLPVILAVVLAELGEGGMDSRVLAILGVLSAVNAVLRLVSAGTAGLELVFFLLILGGRVFGAGFGFVLGCTSLFASALMTAGVGPWLPFQMIVAAWVGMGAGLLPRRVGGRAEIAMLVVYGVVSAYLYGLLMNLQGWPFIAGGLVLAVEERSRYGTLVLAVACLVVAVVELRARPRSSSRTGTSTTSAPSRGWPRSGTCPSTRTRRSTPTWTAAPPTRPPTRRSAAARC